jgi:putative heme-binding domain-containing protein
MSHSLPPQARGSFHPSVLFIIALICLGYHASLALSQQAGQNRGSLSDPTLVRGANHDNQAGPPRKNSDKVVEELAGNPEVAEILRNRPGRGVMADDSAPSPPDAAIGMFRVHQGLSVSLVASEPKVSQPLFLSWDSAGRLWVVQYRQYQYPAGLKIVRFDQHLRAVFDKTPAAPPNHVLGADVISVLEDTDKDGSYDRQRDVITGLNIATSVAIDRQGIWVLNPPYLLHYPDADQDCVPDGDPEVHLSGFGLQDTHSVANSLMFGPDGWLYGANGSTTGGTIVSAATPSTAFEGQCIWRYDPRSKRFEIYAEGGGNTFSLDIDAAGRVFSGTNGGGTRGWYYPQGSYSQKNFGKHGPLTNPFAFGYLDPMKLQGDDRRFPQAFLVYDGGLLGGDFEGSIIAPNSMHNLVWHSRRYADGSTFRTVDEPNLLESSDRWFRPVYSGAGPDGAIYMADWYDTRLSHVSPVDDWHKESGRIYRIAPTVRKETLTNSIGTQKLHPVIDLHSASTAQLVEALSHPNKWTRQRAALEIGWRSDKGCSEQLLSLIRQQGSLDALWALSNLGELSQSRAVELLSHTRPEIRRWVVRLLGDRREGVAELASLATTENDIEVRSQLAATAKRIPVDFALPVIASLMMHDQDLADPHLPLMIWWALETHADQFDKVQMMLGAADIWQSKLLRQFIASRLAQRYASSGKAEGLTRCASLLSLPVDESVRESLIEGLNKAFLGRSLPGSLPKPIQDGLAAYRKARGAEGVVLAAKQGDAKALEQALAWLKDTKLDLGMRIEAAQVFAERSYAGAIDPLLAIGTGRSGADPALQRVALQALANYDDNRIAAQLIPAFDSTISQEHSLRETAARTLASRKPWALALLQEINGWRIRKSDVPSDVIVQLRTYQEAEIVGAVERAFGKVEQISSPDQLAEIDRLSKIVLPAIEASSQADSAGALDATRKAGEKIYLELCGKCHQLFGKGETTGPRLDSYDRSNSQFWLNAIVAPNSEIREGYQMYQILTHDGRAITGMIAQQDLNSVTLRKADQQTITVLNEEIELMQAMKTSLMPEGILKDLNNDQLQALFVYLSGK